MRRSSFFVVEAVYQPFPMRDGRLAQAWRHHPAYWRPRHFHAEPELNLVLRGEARVAIGKTEYRLGPGEFVVFAPGQDHALLEASSDLDLFVIALEPELAERAFGTTVPRSMGVGHVDDDSAPAIEEILSVSASDSEDIEGREQLVNLFREFESRLDEAHATSRRALSGLLTDPSVGQGEMAARIATAPAELSRKFHGSWGVPFVEMRARHRLIRFIGEVDRGASYTRAAYTAGFGSYAQLHRVFHRSLGITPREYFSGARSGIDEACLIEGMLATGVR